MERRTVLTKETWDVISKAAREYFLTDEEMVMSYNHGRDEPVYPIYIEDPIKSRILINDANGYGGYFLEEGCSIYIKDDYCYCETDETMFGSFTKRDFTREEREMCGGRLCPYLLCLRTSPDLPDKVKSLNLDLTDSIIQKFYTPFQCREPIKTEVLVDLNRGTLKPEENIQVRASLLTKESDNMLSFEVIRNKKLCFNSIPWTTRFRTNDYTEVLMYISRFLA